MPNYKTTVTNCKRIKPVQRLGGHASRQRRVFTCLAKMTWSAAKYMALKNGAQCPIKDRRGGTPGCVAMGVKYLGEICYGFEDFKNMTFG
jgi:hypothetical protein